MIWILFLFLFLFVFHFSTKQYINPYKCIGIFGKKGSGKTTLLTKLALQHKKNGWNVYSTIDIPGTIKFDIYDIGFFTFPPQSVLLIDEIGIIFDNRHFKSFKDEWRDWFKYQRQYKCKVYWFSQVFNDLDLKIRVLTDELWLARSFLRVFSILRRINKNVGIKQAADGSSSIDENYTFDSILTGGLKFTFIPRYVPFFKSFNPPEVPLINGYYLDFNDIQKEYISTSGFLFTKFKIFWVRVWLKIKEFPTFARSLLARKVGQSDDKKDN